MNCGSTHLNKCISPHKPALFRGRPGMKDYVWIGLWFCFPFFLLERNEILTGNLIARTPSWILESNGWKICSSSFQHDKWQENVSEQQDVMLKLLTCFKIGFDWFQGMSPEISPICFWSLQEKKTWATNLKTYYYKVTYACMLSGENIFFVVQIMPLFTNSLLTYHSRTDCPLTSPQCTFASFQLDCDHAEGV